MKHLYSSSIIFSLCAILAWPDELRNGRNRFGYRFCSIAPPSKQSWEKLQNHCSNNLFLVWPTNNTKTCINFCLPFPSMKSFLVTTMPSVKFCFILLGTLRYAIHFTTMRKTGHPTTTSFLFCSLLSPSTSQSFLSWQLTVHKSLRILMKLWTTALQLYRVKYTKYVYKYWFKYNTLTKADWQKMAFHPPDLNLKVITHDQGGNRWKYLFCRTK